MKKEYKIGDKVEIIEGKYAGQTAIIRSLLGNGVMIERDVREERRFCSVMFNHLKLLTPKI